MNQKQLILPTDAPQTFITDNVNIEITSRPEVTFTVPTIVVDDNEPKTTDPEETDASFNPDLPIVTVPATVPALIEQDITESGNSVNVPTDAPQTFISDNDNIEIILQPEETHTVPVIAINDHETETTNQDVIEVNVEDLPILGSPIKKPSITDTSKKIIDIILGSNDDKKDQVSKVEKNNVVAKRFNAKPQQLSSGVETKNLWVGIPQECLSLFLAPDGTVLDSISNDNHEISNPKDYKLCETLAAVIIKLNNSNRK
jgi:hypothetical protein